ncbi:bystin [Dermatophagoides pteronyssinus]|uniref:Bystin-like n=1 Tax=Dermatophagoides pteronyssinus TaxID=6956 RepID=A0A6P6XQL5_DERPT|nr:bystin-like [Dermatophagoides pteronyssinus]
MPKMKRKPNKNRTRTVYPQERPDKKPKFAIKDDFQTADNGFIDSKTSRKILEQAQLQQNELEEEFGLHEPSKVIGNQDNKKLDLSGNFSDREADDGDHDDYDLLDEDEESARGVYESFYEELKLNKEDERALEMFMAKDNLKRKSLADYIRDKLKEKEDELSTMLNDEQAGQSGMNGSELDSRVVELYRGVKVVLQRYRNGRLPKAFKIIPALANWEQILFITEPDCWTAAAMFQATRLFASNLKERMAQRFFNLVLMPRIRDDIEEYKRLNFHLYQSLKKALFKPGAFFKGIIIPLCESGDCTLREAVIIGSIMARNHIPLLHSCAAMLKIAEMDYSGANSIFLNILIQKKYALPYRVIDALFYHFYRFLNDRRSTLPVLWHQCLLAFVQNYKNDLSSEQKESLLELLRIQTHHSITPEIRRELFRSKNRDGTDFISNESNDMIMN